MTEEEKAEEYRKSLKQRLIDEDNFERLEMFDENVEQAFLAGAKLLQEENERLQKQIEKMKNCPNCANDCIYCNEEEKDCDKCPCATCENKSHWKLKE